MSHIKEENKPILYGYFYDDKHFFVETLFKPTWSLHDYKNSWYRGQIDLFKHLIHDVETYLKEQFPEQYKKCYIVFSDEIALKGLTKATKQLANKLEKEGIIKKLNNWYYLNQSEEHCHLCEYNNLYYNLKGVDSYNNINNDDEIKDTKIRLYEREKHLFDYHHFYNFGDLPKMEKISTVTKEDIEKNFGIERKRHIVHLHNWKVESIDNTSTRNITVYLKCESCKETVTLDKSIANFAIHDEVY